MYRIGKEEIEAVARAINSHDFFKVNGSGREAYHFEEEWKAYTGTAYTLLMSSGYAALTAALTAMGIGPGDEVIVPGYTYIATALAVLEAGAIPVICECDAAMTIDVADAERKISQHTKAIIPVHIQGFPCDMDGVMALAKKHNLYVLEDACQADGGSYHGRALGTIGHAGAYSFNYFKVITAGEGGALSTNDRTIYERALIYHDASAVAFFGDQLSDVTEPLFGGTEFRISDITGAILREQLRKLLGILADLRRVKAEMRAKMGDKLTEAPSHDAAGDLGTTLALRFDTAEETRAFAAHMAQYGYGITIPIDTGKHVYTNWTQVMEKRGAFHPAMDPYKMEANRGLNANYTTDMCPHTLDYLSRTAYLMISPDWSAQVVDAIASAMRSF